MSGIENLKYPIGKFNSPEIISEAHIKDWIAIIANFPLHISTEVSQLSLSEFGYKYRPGGWTIKQVLNHCVDSHMNTVVRFKLALTEDCPTIKPYDESAWAELSDTLQYSINDSIILLEQIHKRWVFLLKSLNSEQFNRKFLHPNGDELVSLKENLGIYAWHCQHHLQHIINAKNRAF